MAAERAGRHRFLRLALSLQAAGLLALVALTFPDWIDARLHPFAPCGFCLDLRGLAFDLTATFLGPVIVLLLVLAWRWRGPRRWPLAIVALIDAAAIALTIFVLFDFLRTRSDSIPTPAAAPPLLLLPAIATAALGANLVRPVQWKSILAVSTAGCLLLATFMWTYVVHPVHQSIPGELSLPFSRTAVYEGRDNGCREYVAGWTRQHECTRATLLVYRGSGDWIRDEATINQVLATQQRGLPAGKLIDQLPVDTVVNRTNSPKVDATNAGLCLIITDRVTTAPPKPQPGRCGMVTDYADIRSHWPGADAYAIGIIYHFERSDYVSDHSVTFLNVPLSAEPGHTATLRVRATANTRCSIAVVDASGAALQGLEDRTTDGAGNVDWTWLVDPNTKPGQWPITVTCGSSTGRASWYVYGPSG